MIWIIGSMGMLGQELTRFLSQKQIPWCGSDREVSILEPAALKEYAEQYNPGWIVNCSAYTAVDKAESEPERAYALNRDGVANIATLARDLDIPLIHISTDYVFDGTSKHPLSEDAPTGPVSVYGKSKLAGEEALRGITDRHFILRTAWLYGEHGANFVYTMLTLMNSRDSVKVVNDQHGSPTWTGELVRLIGAIIGSDSTAYGTYHFSGEGQCTWFEFALEIYRQGKDAGIIDSDCDVQPCSTGEFLTAATRPVYSLLLKEKVKQTYDFYIQDWKSSLKQFMEEINKNRQHMFDFS